MTKRNGAKKEKGVYVMDDEGHELAFVEIGSKFELWWEDDELVMSMRGPGRVTHPAGPSARVERG